MSLRSLSLSNQEILIVQNSWEIWQVSQKSIGNRWKRVNQSRWVDWWCLLSVSNRFRIILTNFSKTCNSELWDAVMKNFIASSKWLRIDSKPKANNTNRLSVVDYSVFIDSRLTFGRFAEFPSHFELAISSGEKVTEIPTTSHSIEKKISIEWMFHEP